MLRRVSFGLARSHVPNEFVKVHCERENQIRNRRRRATIFCGIGNGNGGGRLCIDC